MQNCAHLANGNKNMGTIDMNAVNGWNAIYR